MQIETTPYQMPNTSRALRSFFIVGLAIFGAPTARAQQVESLEHDTLHAAGSSLVQVVADTYAGAGNAGFIKTFTIHADGGLPVSLMSFVVE